MERRREIAARVRRFEPSARAHFAQRLDAIGMAGERALFVLFGHRDRRRDDAERANALRTLRRECHSQRAGGGFAAIMNGLDAEVVEQIVEVPEVAREIDPVFQIEILARLPQSAQIGPDHTVEAA